MLVAGIREWLSSSVLLYPGDHRRVEAGKSFNLYLHGRCEVSSRDGKLSKMAGLDGSHRS